jgi:hypothetical protein
MQNWKKHLVRLVFSALTRKTRLELGAKVVLCPTKLALQPIHIDKIPGKAILHSR